MRRPREAAQWEQLAWRFRLGATAVVVALVAGAASGVRAAPPPAEACRAAKNKAPGKYAACWGSAEAKRVLTADQTKFNEASAKCADKFSSSWSKAEDKAAAAGATCPSEDDETKIEAKTVGQAYDVSLMVAGLRFYDHLNGAITDHLTGLQWEKKRNADGVANYADPHDADNTYTWGTGGTVPDGTLFTDFLDKLNGSQGVNACYPSSYYCEWRVPTREELESIRVIPCDTPPCIDPFFGDTTASGHWSATTYPNNTTAAWFVDFNTSLTGFSVKTAPAYVRAVRGGAFIYPFLF